MKECAFCNKTIEKDDGYYMYRENFLQQRFFDSEEDNIFCSRKCAGDFLILELMYESEEGN